MFQNVMSNEFASKYVFPHGFNSLKQMTECYMDDFVAEDPRAFEGFDMRILTWEFIIKYKMPTDLTTTEQLFICLDDASNEIYY